MIKRMVYLCRTAKVGGDQTGKPGNGGTKGTVPVNFNPPKAPVVPRVVEIAVRP